MHTPALNLTALKALDSWVPGLVVELTQLFLDDTPPILTELRTAVVTGDTATVRRLAGHLKGSSSVLFAMSFTQLCQAAASATDLHLWLREVEAEYARVATALNRLMP